MNLTPNRIYKLGYNIFIYDCSKISKFDTKTSKLIKSTKSDFNIESICLKDNHIYIKNLRDINVKFIGT
jgi:hypothetical protein